MDECVMRHKLVYRLDEVPEVAQTLHDLLGHCAVMTFSGSLGAGKTTLIRELLHYAGVQDEVIQSPTFNYVSIYTSPSGWRFYHFDLYRIKSLQDFNQAGFADYLYEPQSYALIEWPEIIMPILTQRVCHIDIDYINEDSRCLVYSCVK